MLAIKLENIVCRDSGVHFQRHYGKRFDMNRMMKAVAQGRPMVDDGRPKANITRFIVSRKGKKQLPHLQIARERLNYAKHVAEYPTRELWELTHNNQRDYLLEVPNPDNNQQALRQFLEWLDKEMAEESTS